MTRICCLSVGGGQGLSSPSWYGSVDAMAGVFSSVAASGQVSVDALVKVGSVYAGGDVP